ncbi:recombinase family protein [Terasakiella sp. SH-1]|uniref:recombinase family protein n=1 Tax=Terasakiella sp. SH-1 TaxID=2560057 RepID=UPI0014314B4E|nr:recombinase family protein [Terasakiella sp. SH-1]
MSRLFGYSRVSTSDQDWSLQKEALLKHGCDERDIFCEKASGTNVDRIELNKVLELLRSGDKLVVWRLDRLCRSQMQLLKVSEQIEAKGAELVSIMDNIDTSTATGKLLFSMLGALAEFEKNLLIERTKAGQAVARENGKTFGRPKKLTTALARQIQIAHDDPSTTMMDTCRHLNISKSTYYNALKAAV